MPYVTINTNYSSYPSSELDKDKFTIYMKYASIAFAYYWTYSKSNYYIIVT